MASEIEGNDLISQSALEAPGKLADQLERVAVAINKILASSKKSEAVIGSSKSTSKITTETEKLTKSQRELASVQEKAAKIAKVVWLSQNEVAESQKKATQTAKQMTGAIGELDKKLSSAAGSATAYANAQKESNKQSAQAEKAYKAEAGSLADLTQKRIQLKNSIISQKKDQAEDLDLLKKGVITRSEYNKRLAESEGIIERNNLAIQALNGQVKNHILTNSQLGGEYKKLTIQLESARNKYKDLAASGTATSSVLKQQQKVVEDLNKKVATIDNSVGQFQRNVGNYPRTFGVATQSLTRFLAAFGIVTGIALFAKTLKEVISLNVEFEATNSKLAAILGVTKREIADLREQQIKLAETTLYTADQYANLQIELAKLGFPIDDIEDMTESTGQAAIAMGSELGPQAELTGSTIRAFGLEASDVAMVNDQLSKSTAASALSFEKLATGLPYVASNAKLLGFSLNETLALMGRLSNTGLQASTIGTSLRSIFLELADSSSELSKKFKEPVRDLPSFIKGLKRLKEEGTDLGEALQLSDKRSVSAFASLVDGTESVEELSKAIQEANGFTKELADTVMDNLKGDFMLFQSAVSSVARELGESMDSALRTIIKSLTAFVYVLREIPPFLKENRALIGALILAILAFNGAQITATALALKDIAVKKVQIIWNRAAAVSFQTLGASIYAALGPLGLFLLAIAAVTAAVAYYDRVSERSIKLQKERNELSKGLATQTENITKAQKSLNIATEDWLKMSEDQKKSHVEQIEFTINHTKAMIARLRVQKIQIAETASELTLWQKMKAIGVAAFFGQLAGFQSVAASSTENITEATEGYNEQLVKLEEEIESLTHLMDKNTDADKENIKTKKELSKEAMKAQLELDKFRLENQIKTLEEIQKNENNSLETRLAATDQLEKLRSKVIDIERRKALLEDIKSEAQRVLIAEKAQHGQTEVLKQGNKERDEIKKEQLEKDIKDAEYNSKIIVDRILAERQRQVDGETALIQKQFLNGQISREKADKLILQAQQKADADLLKLSIDALNEQIETERRIYFEERIKLVNESTMSEVDKAAAILEIQKESAEEQADIEQKIHDLRVKLNEDAYEQWTHRLDDEIGALEKIQDVYEAYADAIGNLFDSISARRTANIDAEIAKNDEYYSRLIELAGDNENYKAALEKKAEERRAALEKRRIAEQRRAAKFEKAAAIISAGIMGSLAVLNQLSSGDPYTAFARAIAAGVLAGVQIAAIAAKPLPAYKDGGQHSGGLARVSEEGPELFTASSGEKFLTPAKETIMHLPAGEITPHKQTMRQLAVDGLIGSGRSDRQDGYSQAMLQEMKSMNKNLSKKQPSESIVNNGHALYRVIQNGDAHKQTIRDYSFGRWSK